MNEAPSFEAPWFEAHWADTAATPGRRSTDTVVPLTRSAREKRAESAGAGFAQAS